MSLDHQHDEQHHAECEKLGVEVVELLRSNTRLNYDVCAFNLIEILQLLGSKLTTFTSASNDLVDSIKKSINQLDSNPDLNILDESLKCLNQLTSDLKSGEKNFYECNQIIENCLKLSIRLLSNQTNSTIFRPILVENRQTCLSLFDIWQLSTNMVIKNLIIDYFNLSFISDKLHISILYDSSNLPAELCCSIKEYFSLSDHVSTSKALKCLILMIENSEKISTQFLEFLKSNDILNFMLNSIESEENIMFEKVGTKMEMATNYSSSNHLFLVDLFIHFILALNKKFILPKDNLVLNEILSRKEQSFKTLSENLIKLLNLEKDPLNDYRIVDSSKPKQHLIVDDNIEAFYLNSVLKFLSDLFSTSKTADTTGIFYLNDFHVLIDIVIRKLTNLSADDQIRVDYLSLIQLIIKNSDYKTSTYRIDDLLECFNSILNEKDQHTVDQDLVTIILTENPELLAT